MQYSVGCKYFSIWGFLVRLSRVFATTTVGLAVVLGLAACGSSGGGTAKTQPSPTTSNHGMSTQEMMCMDKHYAGHNPEKCGGAANGAAYTLAHPLKVDPDGLVDAASIDLSGVKGVTATQQQEATDLLATTIKDLPQWSDVEKAKADGFQSIGDGLTGEEHLLHWDWIDDNTVFDPTHPESLVYKVDRVNGDPDARSRDVHPAEAVHVGEPAPDQQPIGAVPLPRQPVLHRRDSYDGSAGAWLDRCPGQLPGRVDQVQPQHSGARLDSPERVWPIRRTVGCRRRSDRSGRHVLLRA